MQSPVIFDPITKVWRGPEVKKDPYGGKSVGQVTYEVMIQNLQHVCQISDDSGEIYTNERMLKAAISFANALKSKGIVKGDKIIVLFHNHHYILPTWLGCVLAGVILCPFYFLDSSVQGELCELVRQVEPKMFLTSFIEAVPTFKSIFKEIGIECPIYIYKNQIEGCYDLKPLLEEYFTSFDEFEPEGVCDADKDLLIIIMSSSTTGKPKLINGTHSQLLYQTDLSFKNMVLGSTMQPGWHSEFILSFVALLSCSLRVIRAFYTIDEFLNMVEKYKIQGIFIKPKDIFQIMKSNIIETVNLEYVKFIACVGEHMSIKMASDLQKYIPNGMVQSTYGISDLGGVLTERSVIQGFKHHLVGRVRRGFEFIVMDDDGNRLGVNEIGEFGIRSTVLPFPGYYKNKKLTNDSVTPEGFFYSGDMGYLDDDGNIFLIERKKFNISYCGKLLNQGHVERIILENVKGISGVCVVDVESDQHGVMPYIAIIPENGVILKESEIIETVMQHHPFEFETKIFFFDKLPMTISSKFKKHLVREMIMKKAAMNGNAK